ncbi:cytochrome p450 [Colletotrichum sojae]|uniref:Cytochrome p450 n=1 Tax=Colletotrichum sojae TaxID=2175907 RepID=A0A8H6J9I0_9PEZI|nr:cytochrome p450 [Colletotrichum sojae]
MLLQLVARVPSRVFVGPELCANEDWLDVSVNITMHGMTAAESLSHWPSYLRPLIYRFLPKRREENRMARDAGGKASKEADTVGWLDEAAKGGSYDDTLAQLGLSFAAIHTTSELISGAVNDLCDHPEWLDALREEMSTAIKAHGWSKKAMQDMKLTDSLMKESRRHHFGDIAAMHRVASESLQLSDGTRIPKGAYSMVALDKMDATAVFEDPFGFNPRRFLDMRQQPGQENK